MLHDSMTLEHFTESEIKSARDMMLTLLRNDDAVGLWSDKTEVRRKGMTTHIKWANEVDVKLDGSGEAATFARILLMSSDVLYQTLLKLFSVAEEDVPALLAEAREFTP